MNDVLDNIAVADHQAAATELRIGFQFEEGSPWLAMSPGVPAEVVMNPTQCRIPNAVESMLGVLNQGGNVYPIFDLLTWMNKPAITETRRLLLVGRGESAAAMMCVNEPKLLSVTLKDGLDLPAQYEPLAPFVSKSWDSEFGLVLEFDFRKWFVAVGRSN